MEITIHRALSQLKTTQARIEDKLEKDLYISSTIGKTNMAEGRPVELSNARSSRTLIAWSNSSKTSRP